MQTTSPPSGVSDFLRKIEDTVPTDLDVHLIVDNYCTHKHHKVKDWLAPAKISLHSSNLLVLVESGERWFGIISQRAIRRGTFKSVKELIEKIENFVAHYNKNTVPSCWTATADSILEKLGRLCTYFWDGRLGACCA